MEDGRPSYEELFAENAALRRKVRELEGVVQQQAGQVQQLTAKVEQLTKLVDEARRAGKRQAAPFSKGPPKLDPQPPGRKPGEAYGEHKRRAIPEKIDETYDVPLPDQCPHCEKRDLVEDNIQQQYQVEIPRTVIHRQFDIHCGHCADCGQRVQGRHELQTSDALGAAAVQLGPNLQAAIAIANKELGLTHGKIQRLLKVLYQLTISRSTSVRSMLRTALKSQPALLEIKQEIRGSPAVKIDETGWKWNGVLKWLHDFVSARAVLYQIGSRGLAVSRAVLGLNYSGTLTHDGYAVYNAFGQATHQQCNSHLLKRCRELLETATGAAVRFPRAVQELLQEGLAIRDRYVAEELTLIGCRRWAGWLTERLRTLVTPVKVHAGNEIFAQFLERHLDEVFTYLRDPDQVDATNNEGETELRYAVIFRKVSGGNRSEVGVRAEEILPSVIRTCRKLTTDPFDYFINLLTSTTPVPLYPTEGR